MGDKVLSKDELRSGHDSHSGLWGLALGSIGVVYGDIGTSPLYAFREAVRTSNISGRSDVLGVLSLILWALLLIVTIKYVLFLLRADNKGEGGILSLLSLAQTALVKSVPLVFFFGIFGAALFCGDALITPAISILSAVEGLKLVTSGFDGYVAPVAIIVLLCLALVQSHGTAGVANWFGPIMLVWFLALAIGGITNVARDWSVFLAFDPRYAIAFLTVSDGDGILSLGAVFLAVTGAEALYADLGHFGRRPIQLAWFLIVFPALALNYLGQAALVLNSPETGSNPFFLLYPFWALPPMVLLATLATCIASQAVITGAYSLVHQAIQLHLLPRMEIRHTSAAHEGQIYIQQVNILVTAGVLALIFLFHTSDNLSGAYGISVTGTMIVTTGLAFIVIWKQWHWPLWAAFLITAFFLIIELSFFTANLTKLFDGGYVTLLLAAVIVTIMATWVRGMKILLDTNRDPNVTVAELEAILASDPPVIIPGTAIFLNRDQERMPAVLLNILKRFRVLHENNVILTVVIASIPRVRPADRAQTEVLGAHLSRVILTFGFMEVPDVPTALANFVKLGWRFDIASTTFFLSRRKLGQTSNSLLPLWQKKLFIRLLSHSNNATDYFQIPIGSVVEIGYGATI